MKKEDVNVILEKISILERRLDKIEHIMERIGDAMEKLSENLEVFARGMEQHMALISSIQNVVVVLSENLKAFQGITLELKNVVSELRGLKL